MPAADLTGRACERAGSLRHGGPEAVFTIYKLYDMIFFDWFILCRFHFFQYYYPEAAGACKNRKYGFNLKSQLLKLLVLFPAASALAAWICTLF